MDERAVSAVEREGARAEYVGEVDVSEPDSGHIERNWRRLDQACEMLVDMVTATFDRFAPVLNTDERALLTAQLERVKRDSHGVSTVAMRLSSHADLVETQIERLRELLDRCEL